MKHYNVYVMESNRGIYTCKWNKLGKVHAVCTREALKQIAPITEKLGTPITSRTGINTFFEYDNCKYCVEILHSYDA